MKKIFLTLTLVLFVIPFGISQNLPSYVPADGLVAFYPFNGNANDVSGNGNDGVNSGAVLASDRHENQDSAYYFSGSNCSTRIDVDVDTSSIETNQSFSVSLWYKHNGGGCIGPRLMEFWPGSDSYGKFTVNTNKNHDTGSFSPNIDYRSSVGRMGVRWDLKPEEEWTHLVYTIDQSSYKIYQNGELLTGDFYNEFGGQTSGTIKLAQNGAFGRMNHSAWDAIDGYLDDIGIWNRVLDENEIQNLYTSSTGDIILNGVVSAENNQIKNVADPTEAQDAVTLSLLQTKLDELIERIEVLESDAKYDCGLAYFEDFSSCDLSGFNAQGGNITSTSSSFDGCGVYMTHYAGQDPNNFYATDKKFLYGVYELEAIADNGISDNIVYVLQQEELTGGYTFSLRPTGTDNPGWSVYNDGELVDSADTFPIARGNWYHVKIEVLKSSLKLWINDVVLFETDSITPPTDIPGYFKVGVAYSGGFDNLKFTPDSTVCE